MRALIALLPGLACAAMMLFVCVPMMRGKHATDGGKTQATREEVAALREEVTRLREDKLAAEGGQKVDIAKEMS